jgi:hypothetical protein
MAPSVKTENIRFAIHAKDVGQIVHGTRIRMLARSLVRYVSGHCPHFIELCFSDADAS